MKILINGKALDDIKMRFFDFPNGRLLFPEHRIELIETEPILILGMPEKLVIQLFLEDALPKDENKSIKIKVGRRKERNYVFLDAKFQHNTPFLKQGHVRLFFQEIKKKAITKSKR